MLLNASQEDKNYANFDDYGGAMKEAPPASNGYGHDDAVDSEKQEKWLVLSRLNDTVLFASGANRTPHDTQWLFFNRIPRTGGQSIVELLKAIGEDQGFQHQEHIYRTPWQRLLTAEEQKNLATWFEYNFWPRSYDRLALHINFTRYRSKYINTNPAYMTIVRDPVEKFISSFRYRRMDPEKTKTEMSNREKLQLGAGRKWYWRTIDECVLENDEECSLEPGNTDFVSAVPFLCGQHEQCLKLGDKWALQMAKFNAEYEYSVVGISEQWNSTLSVLEHYIPMFFRGALPRYWSEDFKYRHENRNPKQYNNASAQVKQIIKNKLAAEYELYEFLLQRLNRQYETIKHLIPMTSQLPT